MSSYPAKLSDFNLNNIKVLKEKFKSCTIGLSDHSLNDDVAKIAVSLGAKIIEKHIALENQKVGLDINFSLKGKKIKEFKNSIDITYTALGQDFFHRKNSEKKNKIYRRSIYTIKEINQNEKFSSKNIKRIRPSNGLSPDKYEFVIGKKSKKYIPAGQPLRITDIKK